MNFSNIKTTAATLLDVLPVIFLAITFLQSGIDKLVDRTGNLTYLRGHLAKSPLAQLHVPLFWALTALELAAGILTTLGFLQIVLGGGRTLAFWGVVVSAATFLALFLGLRLAKDYTGASGLTGYFVIALIGLYTLA